jgi:hypothetical protein
LHPHRRIHKTFTPHKEGERLVGLEVRKLRLEEEEASRQPSGRGCIAYTRWRRSHAVEARVATPVGGECLLS